MTDLISKQAAWDALNARCEIECDYSRKQRVFMCCSCKLGSAFEVIEGLPPIEPMRDIQHAESISLISAEQKHGKWTRHVLKNANVPWGYDCSSCGAWFIVGEDTVEKYYYCPNCGARMGDDWEEPEINPCRGCDDYDGRGGCKSHGGCGAERSKE